MRNTRLESGERQVAPTAKEIREDHRLRYEFASGYIQPKSACIDIGCGVGYGSWILKQRLGPRVLSVDDSQESLKYAEEHYGVVGVCCDLEDPSFWIFFDKFLEDHGKVIDFAVAFEILEHLKEDGTFLKELSSRAYELIISVPNERILKYIGQEFHHRHYTLHQFIEVLEGNGWHIDWLGAQMGIVGEDAKISFTYTDEQIEKARTIIAKCSSRVHCPSLANDYYSISEEKNETAPSRVMLVGLGPSKYELTEQMIKHDYVRQWDEMWVVNKGIALFPDAEMAWIMDDIADHSARWPAYGEEISKFRGRIMTQNSPDEKFMEYPLKEVIEFWGGSCRRWFHTISIPYILAYAGMIGVKEILMAGVDCSWPGNPNLTESGQSVIAYWIGRLEGIGVKVFHTPSTTFNKMNERDSWGFHEYYGYLRQPRGL